MKKEKYRTEEQEEVIRFIKIILVVVLAILAIYFATRLFVTKDLFTNTTEEVTAGVVSYDTAIVGNMLNRNEKDYYVIIYDASKDDAILYSSVASSYANKEGSLNVYTVDLSNTLNKEYYDKDNTNPKAITVNEIKVGDITLIKVKNGKISKYIEDYDKIKEELNAK